MIRLTIALRGLLRPIVKHKGRGYSVCQPKPPLWKVAVVLSGCGAFDGTEVHEAAATCIHLSRKNLKPMFYAPCLLQTEVINHVTGQRSDDVRSILLESARIARGDVRPLHELKVTDADALIIPGGFGVAKNLSNFATAGAACALNIDVCRIIREFHANKKPMGFMCISPILAARVIPRARITLGTKGEGYGEDPQKWPHASAIDSAKQMGAVIELQDVTGISIDKENLIVTTPAFMYKGDFYEVYTGIGKMVDHLFCFLKLNASTGS